MVNLKNKLSPPAQFDLAELKNRRQQLINIIRKNSGTGLLLLFNTENARFDSNFYYLTNITQPSSIFLLSIDKKKAKSFLFITDKDKTKELWEGEMLTAEDVKKKYKFDWVLYLSEFNNEITKLIRPHKYLYFNFGDSSKFDRLVNSEIIKKRDQQRQGEIPIQAVFDSRVIIDQMRQIKSNFEIEQIQYACEASAIAITEAMRSVTSGINERAIMGVLYQNYFAYGLAGPSYPPIIGSGKNSCVLHYSANNQKIPKNSVVLIDAAGEYNGYCADITRTVPANKKFTPAQKAVYEIVLKAQRQAITYVKKNRSIEDYHQAALKIIVEGLRQLKLLKGSVDKIIDKGSYKKFYMHKAGHFLGLDTHDVGIYRENDKWLKFKPGMIVTVEPGIYIRAEQGIPKEFHNIGIRLEDDILVTNKGNQNLTASAPIEIAEIEALY